MRRQNENGNILFMILIAVVLLGALTYTMTRSGGDEATSSVQANRIGEDLKNQAQMIRAALLECVLVNNYGYPADTSAAVRDLKCRVSDTEERAIFTGTASRVLPIPPKPFEEWQYANDGAGTVNLSIATPNAKAGSKSVISALNRAKESFVASEVDIVNNGAAASFTLHVTKP